MIARRLALWFSALILVLGGAVAVTWMLARRPMLVVPPASSSMLVVRPTPDVLLAVRALARLETVRYHMERVIDLSDKQSRLFGLIESEDALLLVAVANITAGVDLQKLAPSAIESDTNKRRVRIQLPAPELLSSSLDDEATYVHTRRTGLLARRREDLETRARVEAERTLADAARQAGILEAASKNAVQTVEALLHSLGFTDVEVSTASPPKDGLPFEGNPKH